MAKTAPTIDRFVFAGGRVLECENSRGVEPDEPETFFQCNPTRAIRLSQATAWLRGRCDSPIEIALASWLFVVLHELRLDPMLCGSAIEAEQQTPDAVLIVPQFRWQRYFTDIAVRFPWLPRRWIFIECDGAAFHSGEVQIARDRGRQQEMADAGYRMFRFTGKEINGNPLACIDEVLRYALAQRRAT